MGPYTIVFLFFILLFFVPVLILVGIYNKFVKYKNKVAESLSLVDVYLKMRFDLVPNLVEVVKGYTKHEKEVLEKVVMLRNLSTKAENEKEKINLANQLVDSMKQIFVVVENYPDLKASNLYSNLFKELSEIEEKIAASRRFYNSNVNSYNTLTDTFPSNVVAGMFNFKREELFKIEVNEKILPQVKL